MIKSASIEAAVAGTSGTLKNDEGTCDWARSERGSTRMGGDGAIAENDDFSGVPVFQKENNIFWSMDYGPNNAEHRPQEMVFQVFQTEGAADEAAFAERAAVLEHDEGLPRAEAERLAAAEQGFASPEALFDAVVSRWDDGLRRIGGLEGDPQGRRCIKAALAFIADGWAATAPRCGWTELELVGACPRAPWARLDRLGASYSMFPVLAVTDRGDLVRLQPGALAAAAGLAGGRSLAAMESPGEHPSVRAYGKRDDRMAAAEAARRCRRWLGNKGARSVARVARGVARGGAAGETRVSGA